MKGVPKELLMRRVVPTAVNGKDRKGKTDEKKRLYLIVFSRLMRRKRISGASDYNDTPSAVLYEVTILLSVNSQTGQQPLMHEGKHGVINSSHQVSIIHRSN